MKKFFLMIAIISLATFANAQQIKKSKYPNGKIRSLAFFNQSGNLAHGLTKTYHDNGNLKSVVNFSKGKTEGPAVFYYKNGKIKMMGSVSPNGELSGRTVYFSETTGLITSSGILVGSKKVGVWVYYNADGTSFKKTH